MKSLSLALVLSLAIVPASVTAQASAQAPADATDLTGTWNASFTRTAPDGRTQTIPFTFQLIQKGKVLTGTIAPDSARIWKIDKGVVDGNKVTFQVQQPDGPLRTFNLTLEKGHLKGTQKAELDGQSFDVVVDAVRAPVK